jgi:CubicO group peptidase (beta-lactamase class C family)
MQGFGHTGFTGTFVWADPANDMIIIFLSNRVYPDAEPNKLVKTGLRTALHDILYEAYPVE